MEKNDRKPEIRFSGFETAWQKKCFGDEFDILSNNTLSREFLNYDQGIAKNVHYGDVLIKFNEYLDASKEVLPYIEDEKVIDKFQNSFLRDGDIVIADTAEDETVGKCTEIGQIRDLPIIAGLHTMPCRPKGKYAPKYLGYYLNADAYHRELLPLMQGVKVTSISRSGVKDTDIIVSEEYDEQKKIGQYLFTLDEKIKFEKDKLDRLIILKKSMLEKMFPQGNSKVPEIRFGKYTDEWEQRKLSEFVDKAVDNRGKTPPLDENGTHPLIEVAALGGVHPDYTKVEKYLNDNSFENNLRAYIKEGDILFTTVGSIGLVSLMDSREEAAIAQNIVAFRAKENYVPEYLYALFSNEDNHYKATRIVMGAVQPSIKVSQLVDVEYMLTENVEEQTKIGAYFSNLDNLITFHQRKVDKLKNIKSSCMDKMFV